ncbi:MAG: penicillin-binding protein 2 [Actinomycetota bacterium]|nr:penicillin-binding protein 2 [Actinomycetota bacterium]
MTEGRMGVRLRVLATLCAFMFAALGVRLWFVQVLASTQYRNKAEVNGTRLVPLPAPRGLILDRNGDVLVNNRTSLVVTVNRQEVGDREESVLFRLSKVLHTPVKDLVSRLNDPSYYSYTPIPVAFDVTKRVAFYLGEHQRQFRGVETQELTVRGYPNGDLAAHVLGYTGLISADQLKDPRFHGYSQQDVVGKSGVEETYEQYLQGRKGQVKLQVNSAGKTLKAFGQQDPVAGDSVVLSIDAGIQKLAEDSLHLGVQAARAAGLPADAGAVIVEDPNNGQILAMASYPTFDPSFFVRGFTNAQYKAEFTRPARHQPLFDRAIQATYPAGSTFKPFVALSALRHRIASENGFYSCPASYEVPGDTSHTIFENWAYPQSFGTISLTQALVISCDTVFYQFGYKFWQDYRDSNKTDLLQNDLRSFWFGRPTGLDLPSENSGVIPDPQWKDAHFPPTTEDPYANIWKPGDLVNMSIGQGNVAVTPLQMATAYSAIANGGTVYRPHVGLRIQGPDGSVVRTIKPRVNGHLPFSQQQLFFIRQALQGVISDPSGTAASAFQGFPFGQVSVAGKTGTAEVSPFVPYSWFAAMAPVDHPKYVVVALVEQGGHGSQTAAPVVRRILEGLYGLPLSNPVTGQVQD